MEQQKNSKKALKITLSLFLAVGLIVSLLPFGAAAFWHRVFSFFGLNDFSAAADSSPMSVHVLEVGKADSIFIECGGKTMLIDGGTMDQGESIAEYLDRRGVKKLDCVVNTHPDEDHIGGLAYLIGHYRVGKYFAPDIPKNMIPSSEEYLSAQKALNEKRISTVVPRPGETFSLGSMKIEVLAPVKQGDSTNNNSIVLKLTYGKTRFLLMGDAEKEEESDLLAGGEDLSADVLKVGHHGSGTSTTDALLNAVKPKWAAISVADDSNGLPKREVLKRLLSAGAAVYRTDVSGTLIFMSDGQNIKIKTER
ncbi:ComEC/Rec2 family competence protein [Caproiciproducens faecalis]|uniref:MBL fold metallo-hydrolase n=1 Tax=Caproiciproducens faecalis TaxID=2820301 RepID=A0ABS7DQH9_9FIRM|nr:ComEC/Rec2 family competence protein [Caproiciproducens faecalis]MBW7573528.1 MBL fold metallo-hydrolase [Caproiciproducens faecalis]